MLNADITKGSPKCEGDERARQTRHGSAGHFGAARFENHCSAPFSASRHHSCRLLRFVPSPPASRDRCPLAAPFLRSPRRAPYCAMAAAPPPPPGPPNHFGSFGSGCAASGSKPSLRRAKTAPTLAGSQWRREPLLDVTNEVLGAQGHPQAHAREGRLQVSHTFWIVMAAQLVACGLGRGPRTASSDARVGPLCDRRALDGPRYARLRACLSGSGRGFGWLEEPEQAGAPERGPLVALETR